MYQDPDQPAQSLFIISLPDKNCIRIENKPF